MDERLQELFNTVCDTASRTASAAQECAYGVGQRASALLSVGKINVQITDLRAEINTRLREIGELVYATHTGDPTDSEVLLTRLQDIDALYGKISALSAQARRARGVAVCSVCGAEAEPGDLFCRSCGSKL